MKLLIVADVKVPPIGGTDERVFQIATKLHQEFNASVIIFCDGKTRHEQGLEIWSMEGLRGIKMVRKLRNRIRDKVGKLDVLQVECLSALESALVFFMNKSYVNNFVLVLHDKYFAKGFLSLIGPKFFSYFLFGLNLLLYDKIIVPGGELKQFFVKLYGRWLDRKIVVIPNGAPEVNLESYDQIQVRKKYGIDLKAFVLVFFARMDFEPNREAALYLIKSSEAIVTSFQELTGRKLLIVIAGLHSNLLPPAPHVKILGFVKDLFEVISIGEACVIPHSRSYSGPHVKTMYCLATGKPVITTLDGIKGMPGLTSNVHVLLFDLSEPSSIGKLAANLASKPRLADKLGHNSRLYAQRWNWTRIAKLQYESVYAKL